MLLANEATAESVVHGFCSLRLEIELEKIPQAAHVIYSGLQSDTSVPG